MLDRLELLQNLRKPIWNTPITLGTREHTCFALGWQAADMICKLQSENEQLKINLDRANDECRQIDENAAGVQREYMVEIKQLKAENKHLRTDLRDEVFEILGEMLGSPCDHGFDDYMDDHCEDWCGGICGSASDSMCWKKLIYTKYEERGLSEEGKN